MLRAVLDANVYISALASPTGTPGRLIQAFLRESAFTLVMSPAVAEEASRVLEYPKVKKCLDPAITPATWFEGLLFQADLVTDRTLPQPVCKDPDDDKYLAAALEGRCDFVVSGDRDLLALGAYEGIRIITPRDFMTRLQTRGG